MREILVFLWAIPAGLALAIGFSARNGWLKDPKDWIWQDRWAFYLSAVIIGFWLQILGV